MYFRKCLPRPTTKRLFWTVFNTRLRGAKMMPLHKEPMMSSQAAERPALMHGVTLCFALTQAKTTAFATQARQLGVRAGRGLEWACNARTPPKLYSSLLVLNPLHRIQCWLLQRQGQRTKVPRLWQRIWRCQSPCFSHHSITYAVACLSSQALFQPGTEKCPKPILDLLNQSASPVAAAQVRLL